MSDYCLFTLTHPEAKRIYIRGIADITEPIDDYEKIIEFYDGLELKKSLPSNPYREESEEFKLFDELLMAIRLNFEDIGDDLVFSAQRDDERSNWINHSYTPEYVIDMERVVVDD